MNAEFEIAYLAGGCFWCTEAVFKRVPGVLDVTPGYTGGTIKNPCISRNLYWQNRSLLKLSEFVFSRL